VDAHQKQIARPFAVSIWQHTISEALRGELEPKKVLKTMNNGAAVGFYREKIRGSQRARDPARPFRGPAEVEDIRGTHREVLRRPAHAAQKSEQGPTRVF
jgi:hypothetical protein